MIFVLIWGLKHPDSFSLASFHAQTFAINMLPCMLSIAQI